MGTRRPEVQGGNFRVEADTRRSAIRAIAEALLDVPEAEVDAILREADGHEEDRVTPTGWENQSPISRRIDLIKLLEERDDIVLETLLEYMSPAVSFEPEKREAKARRTSTAVSSETSIFVVHGHARAELYETVRVLERATGLEVTILHEQPNSGRTILEKFEDHATIASYSVVLLTADDAGGVRSADELRPRGRQNVIFELGFFFGKLGRDRVTVLLGEGVEKPSDIDGLVYITLDTSGAWKQTLARELQSANIPVDYSRIP